VDARARRPSWILKRRGLAPLWACFVVGAAAGGAAFRLAASASLAAGAVAFALGIAIASELERPRVRWRLALTLAATMIPLPILITLDRILPGPFALLPAALAPFAVRAWADRDSLLGPGPRAAFGAAAAALVLTLAAFAGGIASLLLGSNALSRLPDARGAAAGLAVTIGLIAAGDVERNPALARRARRPAPYGPPRSLAAPPPAPEPAPAAPAEPPPPPAIVAAPAPAEPPPPAIVAAPAPAEPPPPAGV
jgi:hypothetical protein